MGSSGGSIFTVGEQLSINAVIINIISCLYMLIYSACWLFLDFSY